MTDVELVIKIPKKDWEFIKEADGCRWSRAILDGVINGTPLPKEHGDLIDRKEAMEIIAKGKRGKAYFGILGTDWEVIDFLKTVPIIIEADKEEDNVKIS